MGTNFNWILLIAFCFAALSSKSMASPPLDKCGIARLLINDSWDESEGWKPLSPVADGYMIGRPEWFREQRGGRMTEMFLIETKEGTRLVKLVRAATIDGEGNLQRALGEAGVGPRVFGKVSRAQLDEWGVRFTFSRGYDYAGILMEVIENAWAPKETYFVPKFVNQLSMSKINEQLDFLETILTELQVYPDDLQVLITEDSRVHLIDFGQYSYPDSAGDQPTIRELFAALSKKIEAKIGSDRPMR